MKKILALLISASALASAGAQTGAYTLDIDVPDKEIKTGHLNLGGTNPAGGSMSFNSFYMELDGQPFIPIMGEIHFSRVPNRTWEEEILKVKAGGVNIIATYVFWSMHEETEGVFDWSGDRNLRGFLDLCRKHDMKTIVRIGPFCHGEIRNGGIPDWLYGRPFQIRTNDPEYLKYVGRHWDQIARQLEGAYYKDGGIVVGIQLENELQHSAAPWAFNYPGQPKEFTVADYDVDNTKIGVSVQENRISSADAGERHMRTLKEMAVARGMVTPLYTATGWGNAAILPNELIPVTSAYPYPFWSETVEASPFYLFKDIHKNPDYAPVRYVPEDYPSFNAEMGAGIQMIYSRRPRVPADAAEALMLRSLGSGANGIGYYMYHGGTTPQGRFGFFSDELMGVPKMSYDFQAPIGEFGKTRDSYGALRIIHNFTTDFGHLLAPMGVVLPEGYDRIRPEDDATLRYAVRKKDGAGFVFITNFQDHSPRRDLEGVSISLSARDETLRFPNAGTMTVPKNVSAIMPFNLDMDGILLKTSTAQPLAVIRNGGVPHYFFFAHYGMAAEYVFDKNTLSGGKNILKPAPGLGSTVKLRSREGKEILLTTLTRQQALEACKVVTAAGERLLVTAADVMQYGDGIRLQDTAGKTSLEVFPAKTAVKGANLAVKEYKYYSDILISHNAVKIDPVVYKAGDRRFQVNVPESAFEGVSDLILEIDYTGDTAVAFIDGKRVTDHFFSGAPWRIGLKRFAGQMEDKGIYFYLRPIYKDATYMIDLPEELKIDFSDGDVCRVDGIRIIPEYHAEIELK